MYAARVAAVRHRFGGWQLFTSWKIVDPFFFGQPSGIVAQAVGLGQHGTAYGSLVVADLGHHGGGAARASSFGVGGGIVFGVLLGQVRFLADVPGPTSRP